MNSSANSIILKAFLHKFCLGQNISYERYLDHNISHKRYLLQNISQKTSPPKSLTKDIQWIWTKCALEQLGGSMGCEKSSILVPSPIFHIYSSIFSFGWITWENLKFLPSKNSFVLRQDLFPIVSSFDRVLEGIKCYKMSPKLRYCPHHCHHQRHVNVVR